MSFCPDWIFDAVMARTAEEFLKGEMPLNALSKKYAEGLSEKYQDVQREELSAGTESIVRFLSEVDAGDVAVSLLTGFSYFRLRFETANKPRKLKSLSGAVDDPVKTKDYSADEAVKKFKAYVFAIRSDSAPVAPVGWRIEEETELQHLVEIASRSVSILDGF